MNLVLPEPSASNLDFDGERSFVRWMRGSSQPYLVARFVLLIREFACQQRPSLQSLVIQNERSLRIDYVLTSSIRVKLGLHFQ